MTQSPNLRVATAFFDNIANADAAACADLLHEDLVWWIPGGDLIPDSGDKTKAEIVQNLGRLESTFPKGLKVKIVSSIEQDDKIAFEAQGYDNVHASGIPYNNIYHIQMTMKDGLIFRCKEHMDTACARDFIIKNQMMSGEDVGGS